MAKFRVDTNNTLLTSLVGYWKLDEASGDALDSYGANTLTDVNTVASGAGKQGTSRDFEDGNSETLSITDNAALSMGDIDFSIAGWVNLESEPVNTMGILGKWNSGGNNREYYIEYAGSAVDRFRLFVSGDGTASTQVTANNFGAVTTGTWYFVHAYHDSANNLIGISVNNGTADTASHSTGCFDGNSTFYLGSINNGALSFFDGLLDEWGVWKKLLSAQEVTDLYNGGNGNTIIPGGGQSRII